MKVKTSITLSENLLEAINKKSGKYKSRSDFIENALWIYLTNLIREEQNNRDHEIINDNSERLNKEATEVLEYQVFL